jgi:hypothetical protein
MQEKGVEGTFTLIQPEKQFIVTDKIKGFYAKLGQIYSSAKENKLKN